MGVYNGQKTLKKCIDSVINQSYTNWEFIICDDCSTDETYKILLRMSNEDKRIKVIHNDKNHFLAASLNRCLSEAHGEYIARMDADDVCIENRLARQVSFLENHPQYAVVGTGAYVFDGEKDREIRLYPEYPTEKDLIKSTPYMHPSIMMRKDVYDALGGYYVSQRTTRGQDLDLWYRFYEKKYKGYNIQEPLLVYHETLDDYKKRTIKSGFRAMETNLIGLRRLNAPAYMYFYAFRPLVSTLIPSVIMKLYHKKKSDKKIRGNICG